jgi:diaminohydroxyphosphoribosylaminopyrimidine deaminase / 5-amino-6-(5-phosphoribosylamino)uracil reductase
LVLHLPLHIRAGRDPVRLVTKHQQYMARAVQVAAGVRCHTSPNPWVGCVIVTSDGEIFEGATAAPGGPHAEATALRLAGEKAAGATLYTTLEPCSHHGRTPPCSSAIIAAGVRRVVVGIEDPDPLVAGRGIAELRAAGIDVSVGILADEVTEQLRPYLTHRRTGRPFVVLKMASTLDGRTAAPDGTSQWITSADARSTVHQLRAESDAVCVGAGTVRADNPALTVRSFPGPDPRRVVLGKAAADAAVHPCLEWPGPLPELLDQLGSEGVLQLLVEGGASVAASFHRERLVDRYVMHVAPAFFGGSDARPLFDGAGAATMTDLWRGQFRSSRIVGDDIELVMDRVDA